MTWKLNIDTGELTDPNGNVRTTIEGPPFTIPEDVQEWGEKRFREASIADITTDDIADYAQLWMGDIDTTGET